MLIGSVCIASKANAKKSTLQAMAPIPAFMAGSMLWLRRRNGVAVVILPFEDIGFASWLSFRTPHRDKDRSTKYEGVVGKLLSGQPLCVHHELERLNPLTYRGGNGRIGGRGRPYSETSRDQSGGNGKQLDLAHLSSPIHQPNRNMRQLKPSDEEQYAGLWFPPDVMAITKWSI
jgi:hypothetical protein